jgi:hypothetical protein
VQVKWAKANDGVIIAELVKPHKNHRLKYQASEIDAVVLYEPNTQKAYWLPQYIATERRSVSLRVEEPKNGQVAGINIAADYEI